MQLLKNTKTLVLADQAIFSGTSFLLTVLIARHFSLSSFGQYSAIILVAYLVVSVVNAWTTQIFQVKADRSSYYISFIFVAQFFLMIITGLVFAIGFHLFTSPISNSILLFGGGFVLYDFGRKILLALDKGFSTLVLDFIISALLLLAFYIFQILGTNNLYEMLLLFSVVYIVSLFYILFLIKPFCFDKDRFKAYGITHLREGRWLFLTAISQWWAGNLFVVASGIYLGPAALGAMRLGQSLFGLLNVLLQVFENYVLPQAALKIQQSSTSGINYIKQINLKLAFIFLPFLLLIFTFSRPIFTLLGGKEYSDYGFVLKGLSILYLFIFISQPIRLLIRSMQMNKHFFYAYFISLLFALCSSHQLISAYRLEGVIVGLVSSQIILISYWTFILQLKNINIWKSSTSY